MGNDNLTKNFDDRIYWIECIRVFSAFLVVMQHSISGVWTTLPPELLEWKIINFVFLISRCAVPVFFMCSGIGMLAKKRSIESIFKKNILGLLKVYIAWMLVFGVRDGIFLIQEGYGIRIILNAFIKDIVFGQYHTWFIMTLIGLYLITPILYEIVKREKLMKYFLILSILFTVIIPFVGKLDGSGRLNTTFETINMRFVVGYVMYYVLGYYISRITWTEQRAYADSQKGRSFFSACITSRKKAFLVTAILFVVGVLTAFIISSMSSIRNGEATQTVYGEFAPLGLIINVSFLMLFQILIVSDKGNRWIFLLESCGIGIYLMHPLLLPIASCFSGLSRLLGGMIVYLIALIISLIIGKAGQIFRGED